ncbi:hypothetical protein DFH09DRAFT_1144827 [Mycena vulgaris]|nr:hypothetical protein DFH09DRAFT_1144827 [Mycena vulgaris]
MSTGQEASTSAGLPPAAQAAIDISLGGVVVSNYLSFLTMGGVCCYTWLYFSKFPNDRWFFKLIVALCFVMCAADTAGTGVWVYDWGVKGYANPGVMALTHWAFPVEAMLLGTCSTIVQCFYAWRVWMVSTRKNWIVPILIVCLSVLGWCIVCWMVSIMATHKLVSELTLVSPTVYIWLGGSVGADVLITGSMIYYLDLRFRMKKSAVTHNRFKEIIMRTIECNVLSLVAQAVSVGLFNSPSVGFYFVLTDMTLAKIYTFSLLISLLGRSVDKGGLSGGRNTGNTSSRSGDQHELSDRRGLGGRVPNTQVSITVQRDVVDDPTEWSKPEDGIDKYHRVQLPNV